MVYINFLMLLCACSLSPEELVGVTDQKAILKELQEAAKLSEQQSEVRCMTHLLHSFYRATIQSGCACLLELNRLFP